MKNKKGLLLFLIAPLFALSQNNNKPHADSSNKKDVIGLIKVLLHNDFKRTDSNKIRKIYYSFLPVSSQVPGAGIALVTSTTAGFYISSRKNTSLSTVTFSPYVTITGRLGYTFRSNIWLSNDAWEIMGDTRFLYYPQYTWGLGGNTSEQNKLAVNYKYVRFIKHF